MRILFLCTLLLLAGCADFDTEQHIVNNFFLIAVNDENDLSLSYEVDKGGYIAVVDQTVFAVGFNENYIIVKRHPHQFGTSLKRDVILYYIVPTSLKDKYHFEKDVVGPLNKYEFEQKKRELNLQQVDFSIVYKNLE